MLKKCLKNHSLQSPFSKMSIQIHAQTKIKGIFKTIEVHILKTKFSKLHIFIVVYNCLNDCIMIIV